MAITTINESDLIKDSRTVINDNFTELNTTKAPINSPALTGTPTAPTPTPGDDTTKLATTAYVQGELANYLSLAGGAITGNLSVTGVVSANAINTLQRNTAYAVGDVVYSATLGSRYYLECTVAGTTGATEPSFTTGGVIVDGTCTFVVCSYAMAGEVKAFAGNSTPAGWLLCDGSAVSRTTYARLFEVIGTTYGNGDGATTFNLPNLVDKFVEGSATSGTVKSAGLPNITGSYLSRLLQNQYDNIITPSGAFDSSRETYGANAGQAVQSGTTTYAQKVTFDASRSSSVYGNSTTVQPPAVTMRYIIKY